MKILRILSGLALAACCHVAVAAAVCTPTKPGDVRFGVVFNADGSAAGVWAYWWCVVDRRVTYEWRAAPSTSLTPTVLAQIRAYVGGAGADFVNTPPTIAADDPRLKALRAAIDAAIAADKDKPVVPAK
jgi:hypothetical protein